jgi:hypothetical protein
MTYDISSRGYLNRAREMLDDGGQQALFYAALELRSGIEARLQEYLDAQDHIARKKKEGWRIGKFAKNIEEAFRLGNRVVQLTVIDRDSDDPPLILYYTPVTSKLKDGNQRLGALLHAIKRRRSDGDTWWERTRLFLEATYMELERANFGTLLGPPLLHRETGKLNVKVEMIGEEVQRAFAHRHWIGKRHLLKVDYLDEFPVVVLAEGRT